MKDIAVAVTEWGVHAVACSGLRSSAPASWLGALRNVGGAALPDQCRGLFLDLRELGAMALPGPVLGALASALTQPGIGRAAVLVPVPHLAMALRDAVRRAGTPGSTGIRILTSEGRDRLAIAAAYQWLLNAREPAESLSRHGSEAGASVVPFPTALPQSAASPLLPPASAREALRNAS